MILRLTAPGKWLNANDRNHFHANNKLVQAWRTAAREAAKASPVPFPMWPVAIVAVVHKSRAHKWDAHNLYPTLKACIDGIVDAEVGLPDDDNKHVVFVGIRAGAVTSSAWLELEVTPQ